MVNQVKVYDPKNRYTPTGYKTFVDDYGDPEISRSYDLSKITACLNGERNGGREFKSEIIIHDMDDGEDFRSRCVEFYVKRYNLSSFRFLIRVYSKFFDSGDECPAFWTDWAMDKAGIQQRTSAGEEQEFLLTVRGLSRNKRHILHNQVAQFIGGHVCISP